MTRRRLIRTGLGGLVLLGIAGCARSVTSAGSFEDSQYAYRVLSPRDRAMIAAVSSAMLDGALPSAARTAALVEVVRGVDVAVAGLPADAQAELAQLFNLLGFSVTRGLVAGIWSSWGDASANDVGAFLERWRRSSISLFRSGYQALHQLAMASWYGNPTSWERIRYPGPPELK
jgi:hypothetical protein